LAVSNIATLGHQIYQRMSALGRFIPQDCQSLVADLEDQFDRVAGVADGQVRYLEGVIEFYKARTDTKVTIAAGGLLDESHWVDLKQELPAGKRTHNTELAQDLASLAVDGGLLVVGVEDHDSRAGKVCGVELARLADRVDQVARRMDAALAGVPAEGT
jgi:hypothetical protein